MSVFCITGVLKYMHLYQETYFSVCVIVFRLKLY